MADAKKEDFLDDIETIEAELFAKDEEGATQEEIELDELEVLRAERDELKDRFMRVLADAENSRKRSERDRREAENYGGSKLARDMLPVHDNLKRAIESVTDEQRQANAALLEGIDLTMRELVTVFAKHGIEQIAPEVGDRFDPKLHQAMFEAPVPDTKAGDIIQVMAEGFLLHDRLLRPAQVGVSSTPSKK
ncbi:nucleotide exchange factor GrpE [Pseudohalocynthiibacter aestuariivivens]|jgi:molecular chaperone GrpE|uniref:Protein GrpE n=1 Tax=Pseudohalocynthiibacter aestuariivivens TaxID=1591409 RepID=A0ABV5JM27_9RHOB|nr:MULTISPECIES: nucleotide exchange factor GrpE [Pseudohalocynthiibacter]MBS9717647.1 nucleotide exchange factor GrpE [Pseudohalocynthiibacter aestuariivivens]MCK0102845.1 nucleotide exchange factor GrpE [Pseudohalocynthiibacter sp. F2068]